MSDTYTLTIYIDERLLEQDENGDIGIAPNLTLARMVNGKANTIFQNKSVKKNDFSFRNTFQWKQKYQIGATKHPREGAFIECGTARRDIHNGQLCDWTVPKGKPELVNMPKADDFTPKETDAGYSDGSFYTKNQPEEWKNTIWCETGMQDQFSCIFVDIKNYSGLDIRQYTVGDTYQLSWEMDTAEEGKTVNASVYYSTWSTPWTLTFERGKREKYVSWGYPSDSKKAQWFEYSSDPGKHDPTHRLNDVRFQPSNAVQVRYGYNDNYLLSDDGLQEYVSNLESYLTSSAPSYLVLKTQAEKTSLLLTASLDPTSPSYEMLLGSTLKQKTLFVLQRLIQCLAPERVPLSESVSLHGTLPTRSVGVPSLFQAILESDSQLNHAVWEGVINRIPSTWQAAGGTYTLGTVNVQDDQQHANVRFSCDRETPVNTARGSFEGQFNNIPVGQRGGIHIVDVLAFNMSRL